jgi:TonB family protein
MRLRLVWHSSPWPPDPGKPCSLAISAGLHVGAFFALMYTPRISLPTLPKTSPSEYQQAFAGKEDKIVWYKFRELPKIAPQKSAQARQPMRAEVQAKQAIVSSPKNAPKREQVVLAPVPAIDLPPLNLPNLIAVKLPPKEFTTPPDLVKPEAAKIETPDTPDALGAAPDPQPEAAKLPIAKLPPKAYVPPQIAPKPKTVPKIDGPSEVPDYVPQSTLAAKLLPAERLPSRAFVPPPPRIAPERPKVGAVIEAPAMAANVPAGDVPAVKLPPRAFSPPPPDQRPVEKPVEKKSVVPPQIDADPPKVTIAIATLNPTTTKVTLPAASSPAQFSAGETVRASGATSDGDGKGIVVPDLYAREPDGSSPKKTDLLAMVTAPPGSRDFMNDALRNSRPVASGEATLPAAAPHALATRVSSAPDHRFNGRDVYMMAIQMSNLTSYSGSWLMWYAARTEREPNLPPIAAPVPHRKVDPKYIPSAISDRVEGKVQLFCVIGVEGKVSSIELLRGADERLNASAEEALAKWEFYPATRNGLPVDVDVVVEIPFVLAPPSPR